jgi:adenylate cyclase
MACAADQAAPLSAVEGKVVFLSLAEPAFDDAAHAARFMPHVTDHSEPPDCAGSLHAAGEELAGLQLLAGLTESRLGGDWSEPSGRLLPLVLGIIAAALGSLVTLILAPMPAFLASLALPLAIFIVSIQTIHHGLYFAETVAMFTGPLAMVLCLGFQKLGEERAKQQAEGAFGRYLPPHLLREFAEGRAELEPGGAERRVTVMFADLAGFTALSDRLEAPALLKVVNRYLGMVVAEVEDHRGYVDKFMGDAVMALWGAPISNQQPEYYACLAAIATQEVIDQARARDEDGGEKGFGIKIGIASGPVVVGNVGTETRLSYTAIGQTVNIASRLETLVPVYRCGTIVDSATATGAREDILFRELDRVIVRGARQPIAIYQPVALRANVTADQKKKLDSYAVALARYRARRFQDALDIWRSWAEVDPPSAVMAEEASRLLRDPPRPTWDAARRINRK